MKQHDNDYNDGVMGIGEAQERANGLMTSSRQQAFSNEVGMAHNVHGLSHADLMRYRAIEQAARELCADFGEPDEYDCIGPTHIRLVDALRLALRDTSGKGE